MSDDPKVFADIAHLPEDERIDTIGRCVMLGKTTAFIVDNNKKADRYIKKLQAKFPSVVIQARGKLKGAIVVRVGPQSANKN